MAAMGSAQRRAARPGRRLAGHPHRPRPVDRRSTKGGPAGPPTRGVAAQGAGLVVRSTKGGPAGPPTPGRTPGAIRAETHAQRRAARPGRRLWSPPGRPGGDPHALNEGRPGRAADSAYANAVPQSALVAQRRAARPGRRLRRRRRHPRRPPERSTKGGPAGPPTPGWPISVALTVEAGAQRRAARPGRRLASKTASMPAKGSTAQRRAARPGRRLCPTSTIEASRHTGNTSLCAKGTEKQRLRCWLLSVFKDHSRFAVATGSRARLTRAFSVGPALCEHSRSDLRNDRRRRCRARS